MEDDMEYGYCRISTGKQNIERQVRNIQKVCPDAYIVREVFTGTKLQSRKELEKLLSHIKSGDMIIFDSVSRMSRNAEEGYLLYEDLLRKGVELVFLKEPHINTATYKRAIQNQIELTGGAVDVILKGINEYLMILAREQIRLAFEQSAKEVQDLHQRTREGLQTARLKGKQIGQKQGAKLNVKKAAPAKEVIRKHNKNFGGPLTNEETWKLAGISKMTFYKYLQELKEETVD